VARAAYHSYLEKKHKHTKSSSFTTIEDVKKPPGVLQILTPSALTVKPSITAQLIELQPPLPSREQLADEL
jgi:hypothetical protein